MLNKNNKIKYGVKIWSINEKDLFKEAAQLFKKGMIDFIELYVVPGSFTLGEDNFLNDIKGIPVMIHAPHSQHGFDIFTLDDKNIKLFKNQIIKTADFLDSKFIVVHAESGSSDEIFKENIEKIKDKRILIENMPKLGADGAECYGYSYERLKFIKSCDLNFCFDFGHAVKSALSQKLDYKEFIKKLIDELVPSYFHISNGALTNEKDEHQDLFHGEYDIKWIKDILMKLSEERDIYLVFETPKDGRGLENDVKNINYFRSIR